MKKKKQHYAIEKGIGWCGRFGVKTTCIEAFVTCKDCKKAIEKWYDKNV